MNSHNLPKGMKLLNARKEFAHLWCNISSRENVFCLGCSSFFFLFSVVFPFLVAYVSSFPIPKKKKKNQVYVYEEGSLINLHRGAWSGVEVRKIHWVINFLHVLINLINVWGWIWQVQDYGEILCLQLDSVVCFNCVITYFPLACVCVFVSD